MRPQNLNEEGLTISSSRIQVYENLLRHKASSSRLLDMLSHTCYLLALLKCHTIQDHILVKKQNEVNDKGENRVDRKGGAAPREAAPPGLQVIRPVHCGRGCYGVGVPTRRMPHRPLRLPKPALSRKR